MKTKVVDVWKNHIYVLNVAFQQSKGYFFLFFMLIAITIIRDLVLVVAPKYIFDAMQFGGSFKAIAVPVLLYVGLYLALHVGIHGLTYGKGILEIGLKKHLNIELAEKFMKVDYDFLEEHKSIEMFQRAKMAVTGGLSDLQTVGLIGEQGISGYYDKLLVAIKDVMFLCSVLYVFRYLEVSVVCLILFSIGLGMIFSLIQLNAKVAVREKSAPYHEKSRYCKRLLRSFEYGKEFRVFGMSDFFVSKFEMCTGEFLKVRDFYQRRCWLASVMSFAVNNGMRLMVLISLIYKLRFGEISVGDFSMIFAAILTFSDTAGDLFEAILSLNIFSGFMTDYRNCMNLNEREDNDTGDKIEDIYEIEFRNVWYRYANVTEETYALKNVNVVLRPKEKLSIVGFNGAGKTTFIKLLLGLYHPTRGEILINGKSRTSYSEIELRHCMSAVFQDFKIYALSVEENITLGLESLNESVENTMKRAGVWDKINSLEKKESSMIGGFFAEGDLMLSGGEAQKIAMARSFFRQTPFIALDEPTSALDVIAEDRMYKNVMEKAKMESILFISHRLASSRFCDKILVFDGGEIIEEGTHEQLLEKKGCYYEMWSVQAENFNGR